MSMLCHLSALGMLLIPFGAVLGPLIFWLIKRDQYIEVNRQGKDALNFQITMQIFFIIAGLLVIVGIGILLIAALVIFNLIVIIIASVKSSNGEYYEYPVSFKFIQ
jgi:uncharacterized Tic20 family protein